MENSVQTPSSRSRPLVAGALILGLALVVSAAIGAYGEIESKDSEFTTGASFMGKAEREIESDQAKLSLVLTRTASSTEAASNLLDGDRQALQKAVTDAGISDAEYSFHQVMPQGQDGYYGDYEYQYQPRSFYASQTVVIESKSAAALGEFAQKAAVNLKTSGLNVRTERVEFNYSKLDELGNELQREAVANAETQAKEILGRKLGVLRSLERANLSMVPSGSDEFYGYGNDKTSLKKKIMVTVYVTFRIK